MIPYDGLDDISACWQMSYVQRLVEVCIRLIQLQGPYDPAIHILYGDMDRSGAAGDDERMQGLILLADVGIKDEPPGGAIVCLQACCRACF